MRRLNKRWASEHQIIGDWWLEHRKCNYRFEYWRYRTIELGAAL